MSTTSRSARILPELKVCNKCGNLHTDLTKPVCATCYRPPNRHRPYTKALGQRNSLYRTAAWQRVRAVALERDNHQCQHCSSQQDLIVHHHKEANTGQDQLNLDNLETLCRRCHGHEHAARRARNK